MNIYLVYPLLVVVFLGLKKLNTRSESLVANSKFINTYQGNVIYTHSVSALLSPKWPVNNQGHWVHFSIYSLALHAQMQTYIYSV